MAITYDTSASGGQGASSIPTTAITPANDATIAIIAITTGSVSGATGPGTVLFNGNAVQPVDTQSDGDWSMASLYYYVLQAGDKGSSKNVTADGTPSEGIMAVVTLKGTETTTPVRASNKATTTGNPVTVDVTGLTAGDWVIDCVGWWEAIQLTVGADQDERQQVGYGTSEEAIAVSTEEAVSGTVTMSWTNASLAYWATVAVGIKAAAGAPATPTGQVIATVYNDIR